ncbi:DUF4397 domain-containing protein [Pararobbsia silviterrae]|uniref:DUF4397 domain-containing protein n=1 Tax=Pararobbsia silviterrae TaxID=1792498 RepID=A0A494XC89_9BURK|nr:DUF4397 domain-containing protein [Pararobbsia silviterrae]RKP45759.1 DUF4397 domain-containing protein [Pararobbsia silviterrae]
MKVFKSLMLAGAAALTLAACGGGNDVAAELGISKPVVRYIHAIPAGPTVDFFNNNVLAQGSVSYEFVSGYNSFSSGATTLSYNTAGAGPTNPLASAGPFNAANGHEYTGIALVSSTLTPALTIIDDPFDKGLLNDQARLRVFNASVNANAGGAVDVYVIAGSATNPDITSVTPQLANVAYNAAVPASGSDSIYVDGGTYVVIVTDAGSKTELFRSAPFSLSNNADWLLVTVPTTGLSGLTADAINLLVANNAAGNGTLLTNAAAQ